MTICCSSARVFSAMSYSAISNVFSILTGLAILLYFLNYSCLAILSELVASADICDGSVSTFTCSLLFYEFFGRVVFYKFGLRPNFAIISFNRRYSVL